MIFVIKINENKNELKDLVRIDFEPLENHVMLISDFSEV